MMTATITPANNQLIVTLNDISQINVIKKAISMIRGVEKVSRPRIKRKKSGLDEALDDVAAGRVYHAENVDAMFKDILGE